MVPARALHLQLAGERPCGEQEGLCESKSPAQSKNAKAEPKKKSFRPRVSKTAESKNQKPKAEEKATAEPEVSRKKKRSCQQNRRMRRRNSRLKKRPLHPMPKQRRTSRQAQEEEKGTFEAPAGGLSGKICASDIDNDADLLEFYPDHSLSGGYHQFPNNSAMTPLMMAAQKKKDMEGVGLTSPAECQEGEGGEGKVNIDMQNRWLYGSPFCS